MALVVIDGARGAQEGSLSDSSYVVVDREVCEPDQKRRISALSRGLIQQKDELAKFKSVGTAARVHARERKPSEHAK